MGNRLPTARQIRISKAPKATIESWTEGADLVLKSGQPIEALRKMAARDRWYLAYEHRRDANADLLRKPPHLRAAISRYYYCMYHAMRAAAYLFHGGDDHEQHSALPSKTPTDFPNAAYWQNALKSAREHRNKADYDPYPRPAHRWESIASALQSDAVKLLSESQKYLTSRGCKF